MQAGPSTAAMPPPAATLRVHASDGSVLLAYAHQGPPLDVPLLMPSPSPNPPLPPGNMACYPRDVFLRNFEAFSGGAFKSLSPAQWIELGIVVAGGSVCACLTTQIATGRWRTYPSADVDAFVIAQTEDEALRKVREFCDVASIKRGATYVRTPNTISIVAAHRRNVQIVLRIYPNIAAILAEFDVDSCALAWDGSDVHATERSNRALVTRVNIVDVAYRSWSFEKRLIKYAKRGFAIGVPGLDLARAAPFELVECHVHRSKLPPSHPLHRPPDADAANARSYYNLNAADFALVRRVQRPLRLYTLVELNQLDEYSAERFSFWQTYQELTGLKKLLVAHHLFPRTDPSASKEGRNRFLPPRESVQRGGMSLIKWFSYLGKDYGTSIPFSAPGVEKYRAVNKASKLFDERGPSRVSFLAGPIGRGAFDPDDWERGIYPAPDDTIEQPPHALSTTEINSIIAACGGASGSSSATGVVWHKPGARFGHR
ncbi:hypothetical protein KFE25_005085 [Diacronema lutheri]|uniref:Uncharacterized protein n=2 Tax=Diacronema lutheri TaxID=2081491 RepID=A0A8J5X430_DIALT|nr:hypothetical protein KFE25_005085 [Diacronema lutheri]